MDPSENATDPLRERVAGNVSFRDDDPPEVREAILREALRNEKKSSEDFLSSSVR
jgi:hypothetical protein